MFTEDGVHVFVSFFSFGQSFFTLLNRFFSDPSLLEVKARFCVFPDLL